MLRDFAVNAQHARSTAVSPAKSLNPSAARDTSGRLAGYASPTVTRDSSTDLKISHAASSALSTDLLACASTASSMFDATLLSFVSPAAAAEFRSVSVICRESPWRLSQSSHPQLAHIGAYSLVAHGTSTNATPALTKDRKSTLLN